jgi:3-hydroxybutyryl-CoA dehydrogenase
MGPGKAAAAIIGGGVMGGDIAVIFAAAGWDVHVMSPSPKTRDALPARLAAGLKKLGSPEANAANVRTHADLDSLPWRQVDLVVEAATEDLPLKHKLFAELERLARPEIPLTSNTSTFPIGEIGRHVKTRSRVAGLHFFMPAHLVPLVEVISAEGTDPALAERLVATHARPGQGAHLGQERRARLRRQPAPARHDARSAVPDRQRCDHRRGHRYGRALRFRLSLHRLRPVMQKEMSGLDTHYLSGMSIYPHLYNEQEPPPLLKEMVAKGHIGMKAKHGFWEWDDAKLRRNARASSAACRRGWRYSGRIQIRPGRSDGARYAALVTSFAVTSFAVMSFAVTTFDVTLLVTCDSVVTSERQEASSPAQRSACRHRKAQ